MTTQPAAAPLLRPDGSPVRVLVVDDEQSLTELLSMALRYEGWEVSTATRGLAAVRTAKEFRPDAVVLDVMMPDIDGREVLRRLRGCGDDVPVLFLTARRRRGPGGRAHRRRRRLRDEAVQPRGGRGPPARPDAAHRGRGRT